jgi:putative spermidine/putrescine transport system substrate-binding protein
MHGRNRQTVTARMSRRQALRMAGATVVGVAAAACTQGGAGQQAPAQQTPATKDVSYDGGIFDAGGATLKLADWGGFWEEMQRKNLLNQFEKDFNCRIQYDSSFPWFPKFAASGPKSPAFDVANWNLPEMFKTARAGDYFVPLDELKANVPNSQDLWPFAFENGKGITYLFSQYGYAYRKDQVDPPPAKFTDFWEDRFSGRRGSYITSNTLQMVFFMMASLAFGNDEKDLNAGFDAMQRAMPMKISDFTGNMQTLLERGEVVISVQHDGEPYAQIDKGVPLGWMYWTEKQPILTQTKTVSRYSEPVQKKLGYALINRSTDPAYLEATGAQLYVRPTNRKAAIPENLASKGVVNTEDAARQLWIPPWDWYLDHEQEITERVNTIFGA